MHAHSNVHPIRTDAHSCLQRADTIQPGQPFMRAGEHAEVLATMTYGGSETKDPNGKLWAVVINVSSRSTGYLLGQLVPLRCADMVQTVREAAPAIYSLEH